VLYNRRPVVLMTHAKEFRIVLGGFALFYLSGTLQKSLDFAIPIQTPSVMKV